MIRNKHFSNFLLKDFRIKSSFFLCFLREGNLMDLQSRELFSRQGQKIANVEINQIRQVSWVKFLFAENMK